MPICADESIHGVDDLDELEALYDVVNIKLDKTGGLTAALRLKEEATRRGLRNHDRLHGFDIAVDGAGGVAGTGSRFRRS